ERQPRNLRSDVVVIVYRVSRKVVTRLREGIRAFQLPDSTKGIESNINRPMSINDVCYILRTNRKVWSSFSWCSPANILYSTYRVNHIIFIHAGYYNGTHSGKPTNCTRKIHFRIPGLSSMSFIEDCWSFSVRER